MRVTQLGEGRPEIAVVGAIHGDEPCGVTAIERLLEDDPPVTRPVKLIVANEEALERGVRYIDADLNRAFDFDTPPEAHERGLAEELAAELRGLTVLSIHSTQSYEHPFAVASGVDDLVRSIVPHLSVRALVDAGDSVNGRLFEADADIVEVEAGLQGTDAAGENAYRLVREFLTATGVLPGELPAHELPVYALGEPIEKPSASAYSVVAENFQPVDEGEPYAQADDRTLTAEFPFYPVLLSAHGYQEIFGYVGERLGTIGAA